MQKLRPPTWRRSRTPTPVEMRSSGQAANTTCSAIATSSSSLDLVSRQASSGGAANESHHNAPDPLPQQPSKESQFFLRLPVDPLTLITAAPDAAKTSNNRGRSRSFDFSHHQEAAKSLSVDLGTNAHPAAAASSGSGPLLGMLRRSFSRNSSTSEGQRSSAGCATSAAALGGSLGATSSVVASSGVAAASNFCVHCLCVEEYERMLALSPPVAAPPLYVPANDDFLSESEYDSNRSSSCCESAADDPHDSQVDEELDDVTSPRLINGFSANRSTVAKKWSRGYAKTRRTHLAPDSSARPLIRRGRSLGLASDYPTPWRPRSGASHQICVEADRNVN